MPVLPRAGEPLDLRLVLPATAVWLVAWQGRLLPPRLLLSAAAVAAVAAVLLLACRDSGALGNGSADAAGTAAGAGGDDRPGERLAGPQRRRRTIAAAVLGCAAASATVTAVHVASRTTGPLSEAARDRAAVTVEAVLTDDPRRVVGGAGRPRRDLVVVRLRVVELRSAGRVHRLRASVVLLSSDRRWLPLLPSQRVRAQGRLRPAAAGDDVTAVLSGRGEVVVLSAPSRVQRAAGHLRAGLRRAVEPLPAAEQGLLPGLVVGDTSRLDEDLREDFRTVGLSHLTAVSGTNVAIVTGAVLLLCRRLGAGARAGPVVAALALAGFVVLARPSPSVLRAAVMGAVALVALSSGNRRAAMPALAAAVVVLVLVDPDLASTPGFALSVLATAGLLVLAPGWREALARRMPGWLADAVAVPAAAQVACGPVVVAISSSLGLLSVPANLLAVPAVAPATVSGVVTAMLAPVSLPVAQAVAWVGWLPTAWLVLVARTGARLPGASLAWPAGLRGALLLALATVLAFVLLRHRRWRRVTAACAAGVAVATTVLAVARPSWPPPGWFFVACDVGQGDALVLSAGPGRAVVVDAGPDADAVDGCLSRLGVHEVPLVLLTHAHADHVDGLAGVLRGRRVAMVQVGPLEEPAARARDVRAVTRRAGVRVERPALGEQRALGPLSWQVLAPGRPFNGTSSDPNNSSLVVRLAVGPTTVLLTGDVEPEAQRDLLYRGLDLRADVLKVPHHGSAAQEPAFLDAVGASVAITSVGADNTYGHPSPETLDRLTASGARSFRTDLHGDVALNHRRGQLVVTHRGSRTTR